MEKNKNSYVAVNTQNFIWLFAFALLLGIALICFFDGSAVMGVIFSVLAVMPVSVILLSPLYYVFTDEGVTIVYTLGGKEKISWRAINKVKLFSSWLAKGSGSPHYYISHDGDKPKGYMNSEIAKTFKTQKLMELYCRDKIK